MGIRLESDSASCESDRIQSNRADERARRCCQLETGASCSPICNENKARGSSGPPDRGGATRPPLDGRLRGASDGNSGTKLHAAREAPCLEEARTSGSRHVVVIWRCSSDTRLGRVFRKTAQHVVLSCVLCPPRARLGSTGFSSAEVLVERRHNELNGFAYCTLSRCSCLADSLLAGAIRPPCRSVVISRRAGDRDKVRESERALPPLATSKRSNSSRPLRAQSSRDYRASRRQ